MGEAIVKKQAIPEAVAREVARKAELSPDEQLLNYVGASVDGLSTDCGIALTDRQIIYLDPNSLWRVPLQNAADARFVAEGFPRIQIGDVPIYVVGPSHLFRRLLSNLAALTGHAVELPHALPPDGVKFLVEIPRGIDIQIPFGLTPEWPDACARCCKVEPTEIFHVTSATSGSIVNPGGPNNPLAKVLRAATHPYVLPLVVLDAYSPNKIDINIPLPYCKECLATDKGFRMRGPAVLVREISEKRVILYFARRKYLEMFITLNTGRNPAEILPALPGRRV